MIRKTKEEIQEELEKSLMGKNVDSILASLLFTQVMLIVDIRDILDKHLWKHGE